MTANPGPPRRSVPTAPRSTDAADYQRLPRPVAAMPKSFADRADTGWHAHERAQLLYALRGAMAVDTEGMRWTLPPQRALWIPPGVRHRVTMRGRVEMRSLYLQPEGVAGLPAHCSALEITPLVRELIVRAAELPVLYDEAGADGLVMRLLLRELERLPLLPLGLPLPTRPELARLCERWLAEPADRLEPRVVAAGLAVSERTLARRFLADTGMSLGQWVQRARLLAAIERIDAGHSVIRIAGDLGYDSPSAFTAMFRRVMGTTPRALGAGRARAPR